MPKGVEDVLLVGVDQRTPQRAGFNGEGRTALLKVQTTWAGDGTVIRDSAVLERTPLHPTSFADHQRILNDPQIQAFLKVALIKGVDQARGLGAGASARQGARGRRQPDRTGRGRGRAR